MKEGLKETGKKKLSVQLLADDTDASKRMAQFIQAQWQKMDNVKVTIKVVPFKQRLALSEAKKFQVD